MTTTPINDTSITSGFNVDELTEGSLTGKGVLDVLLQTLRLHLDREFTSGRITGTAYATVYSQAITAFLAQAAQYALSKAKLPLELQLLQEQITLAQKQQDQITAAIRQSDYVTDFQLPSEVANKDKSTALLEYDLTQMKPVELSIAQEDLALKEVQTALAEYDLTTIKPQELALLQQQVAAQLYTVQTRLPAEVLGIEADTALKTYDLDNIKPAELGSITADTSLKDYELTDIKPTQKAQLLAQISHIEKQELNTVQQTENLSSQQLQIEAETAKVIYETDYVLVEQVKVLKLNQDQLTAQNNKIATDTVVTIKQGHLTDAQTCQVTAETNRIKAEVATKLPEEVELIKKNTNAVVAQTAQTVYVTENRLPAEVNQVVAQTGLLAYDLTDIKPKEAANLIKTGLNIEAQTINLGKQGLLTDSQKVVADKQALNIVAETNNVNYKTNYVMPEELKVAKYNQDLVKAQTTKLSVDIIVSSKQGKLVDAQVTEVQAQTNQINANVGLKLPEEVELIKRNQNQVTAQTASVVYSNANLLPKQVAQLQSQIDSNTQQTALYAQKVVTEQAQATNAPAATSVMGVQNALMEQQKNQIIRDAEQKTAKIMLDSWQTIFTTDQAIPSTGDISLLLTHVNAAKLKMLQGVGAV